MTPFGLIGDIYIISCAIGTIYLLVGAFLGQFAHVGHSHAALSHGGGHLSHGLSPAQAQLHTGAQVHTLHGGHQLSKINPEPTKVALMPTMLRGRINLTRLLLTFLSPLSIAIFLAFFGIAGIFILKLAPVLGLWSMIPAMLVSLVVTAQVLAAIAWMIMRMHATTQPDTIDLIGQRADVCVPIEPGKTGEVVCVIGQSRYNKPARSLDPSKTFDSGSQVMVADVENNVLLVEPWNEL